MKKELRIKRNHEIASIVNLRKKVASKNYIIYFQNNNLKTRIAFSVSKKLGHAFERNKSKRIARNIFRKYLNMDLNIDMVVIIKPCSKDEKYETLEKEIDFLISLIIKKTRRKK